MKPTRWLAATVAMAVANPVAAQDLWGSATLHSLMFQVIDLDLNDGIAAALTFESGVEYFADWVVASAFQSLPSLSDYQERYPDSGHPAWEPITLHAQAGSVSVTSSIRGDGTAAGSTLSSFGEAYSGKFESRVRSYNGGLFTLTPHTRVDVSAWADVATNQVDAGPDFVASTLAIVYVRMAARNGELYTVDELKLKDVTGSMGRQLQLTFVNDSDESLGGAFDAQTATYGTYRAASIPEPASYLNLLAGLALLAPLRRRRRRKELGRTQEGLMHCISGSVRSRDR